MEICADKAATRLEEAKLYTEDYMALHVIEEAERRDAAETASKDLFKKQCAIVANTESKKDYNDAVAGMKSEETIQKKRRSH